MYEGGSVLWKFMLEIDSQCRSDSHPQAYTVFLARRALALHRVYISLHLKDFNPKTAGYACVGNYWQYTEDMRKHQK